MIEEFIESDQYATPTGVPCPGCRGLNKIVYNGNYFCENGVCGWTMGERPRRAGPARIAWDVLSVRCLAGVVKIRRGPRGTRDTSREEFYLPRGHPLRTHDRGPWDQQDDHDGRYDESILQHLEER